MTLVRLLLFSIYVFDGVFCCNPNQFPNYESEKKIAQLCNEMQKMPQCYINTECESGTFKGNYCSPFATYKDICSNMGMTGCENYTQMCVNVVNGSEVWCQCDTPILNLPAAQGYIPQIKNICNSMRMTDCDPCLKDPATCDSLPTYARLCMSMPWMGDCDDWKRICTLVPTWSICTSTPDNPIPEMRMYFHLGIVDYILFADWVPYNSFTYTVSLIAVFIMAFFHEGFKVIKINFETKWQLDETFKKDEQTGFAKTRPTAYSMDKSRAIKIRYAPFDPKRDGIRALYRTIDIAAHFFIMLVAMTFNVGLFIAIVLGYGFGSLAFSRLSHPIVPSYGLSINETQDCH